ncbi:MAG: hypothetical protein FJW31_26075 [Acidobacteria bacterium]|nr:hypothetical protein [Acidobacteriota bacterium]
MKRPLHIAAAFLGLVSVYSSTRLIPAGFYAAVLSAVRAAVGPPVMAKITDGALHDETKGVSVRLPEGWTMQGGRRYGDGEQTVMFTRGEGWCGLWYFVQKTAPRTAAEVEASLAQGIEEKNGQRLRAGFSGYQVLPDSRRSHEVNGHPALTWQAEFYRKGRRMVKTLTRVESPVAIALFFSRVPADEPLDITPVSSTLRLPSGR